jgi:amino acid transporter
MPEPARRGHHLFQSQRDAQHSRDVEHLARFGYKQELNRSLGFFSNFAIAFSFISATNGFYGLFWYGLDVGGPAALIWSWPVVVFGQFMVALIFAEAASHFPLAGSVYQWCKHLVNGTYGWFAAWMFFFALLISVAGVAFGASPIVCSLLGWEGTGEQLFWIAVFFTGLPMLLNVWGVTVAAFFNNVGTLAEIIGLIVIAIALYVVVAIGQGDHQDASVFFDTTGAQKGMVSGYGGAFLAAMLTSAWVLFGFDSACELAEETANPTRTVPRSIIYAVGITAVISAFWLVAMVLAIPDVAATQAQGTNAIAYIFNAHFPRWVTNLFLVVVLIAVFVCCLAIQVSATRLLFAFGRDRMIPGGRFFAYVNPRTRTPMGSALAVGLVAIGVLLFQSQLWRVVAWATVAVYVVYQMVVLGAFIARLRGWPRHRASFNLGRWGWAVNITALLYGLFMIINLAWPRSPGAPWYDNYLVPVATLVIFALGALVYFVQRVRGINVGRQIHDIRPGDAGAHASPFPVQGPPGLNAAGHEPLRPGPDGCGPNSWRSLEVKSDGGSARL